MKIQKWRTRGEKDVDEIDCKSMILQNHLIYLEEITKLERELKARVIAEGKWFDLLFSQRITMLSEDEIGMIRSGAEVPATPRRSIVIMPGKEATLSAPTPAVSLLQEKSLWQQKPEQRSYSGNTRSEPDWKELQQFATVNVNGSRSRFKLA